MTQKAINFLRYPGGKQRLLSYIFQYMPRQEMIKGKFVEPFVGGGAMFFALNPKRALLSDINPKLIDLYRGLQLEPLKVWKIFRDFPPTKKGYYEIRNSEDIGLDLAWRAAKTLFLNRTCFKGMWRQNSNGQFNVGYGGQDRRWVINQETLVEVSKRLKGASLRSDSFEKVIDICSEGDFLYADPPYRPGERDMIHDHYVYSKFRYDDHKRLACMLKRASRRGVQWVMTTSSHPDILGLFQGNRIIYLPKGTGKMPGILTDNVGEVLICNYEEVTR